MTYKVLIDNTTTPEDALKEGIESLKEKIHDGEPLEEYFEVIEEWARDTK